MSEFLEWVRQGFRGSAVETLAVLGAALALVALGFLLHTLFSARGRLAREGRRLFHRLADASGLPRAERECLLRLARHAGLPDPALVFVRRSAFEGAVHELRVEPAAADSLRRRLYGP